MLWEVYISPKGGAADAMIKKSDNAQSSVLVQAYPITSAPIAKALVNAHKREVKVEVILDKSQRTEEYSSATFFINASIPVKLPAPAYRRQASRQDGTGTAGPFDRALGPEHVEGLPGNVLSLCPLTPPIPPRARRGTFRSK